jgi:hypothetical protein
MPINGVAMEANITGIAKRMSAAYDGVAAVAGVMGMKSEVAYSRHYRSR